MSYDSRFFCQSADGGVSFRPEVIQALECAMGKHETEGPPMYIEEGDEEAGPLGWPEKHRFRVCKHCRCLYKEKP